jgi:hypothetical protein
MIRKEFVELTISIAVDLEQTMLWVPLLIDCEDFDFKLDSTHLIQMARDNPIALEKALELVKLLKIIEADNT